MAARAYLLERQPRQPLIFVPSDTPVSEVVGRMNRLLRNTGLEVGGWLLVVNRSLLVTRHNGLAPGPNTSNNTRARIGHGLARGYGLHT